MGMKVASTCLHLSQPIIPQSPSSSQTLTSAVSSRSSRRRRRGGKATPLVCRYVQRLDQSALFGHQLTKPLPRSRSCEFSPKPRIQHAIRRTCSARLNEFDEDENESEATNSRDNAVNSESESRESRDSFVDPPWEEDEIIQQANIERKANRVDLPLSLRIIKRKLQLEDGFREAGESAYCSIKKAFSSMVFIIRELQSFTLHMREILFYEDLQGILVRVQKEMNASFVWLFQQVFSHTPTLMVYVMILLANFTVHSMAINTSLAAATPPPVGYHETAAMVEVQDQRRNHKFDSSSIKTFYVSSSSLSGRLTSIGGNSGGGGKIHPVASGTDGDGGFHRMDHFRTILPDGANQLSSSFGTTRETESVSGQVDRGEAEAEEEQSLWDSIVAEASSQHQTDESLDHETMKRFVSPVTAKIESDDYADYFKTELLYQTLLAKEPNNPLLLANYAQFLHIVAHDYDRAEEYFKRAVAGEGPDAEALSKYASFLWRVRNDLWAAEETFLEAIAADPTNSYYAANYAHFLWNTGGEDTCFPLSSPDSTQEA